MIAREKDGFESAKLPSSRVEGSAANGIIIISADALINLSKISEAQEEKHARGPLIRELGHPSVWKVFLVEVCTERICGYFNLIQIAKIDLLSCLR